MYTYVYLHQWRSCKEEKILSINMLSILMIKDAVTNIFHMTFFQQENFSMEGSSSLLPNMLKLSERLIKKRT